MIFIGDAQPASYTVECKPVQCKVIVQTKDSNEEIAAEATATTERP
ncbi:MAG: hypothetical protein IPK83_06360 [Planctomycetes bacterium]|nr:hypothetical protein [Planctomycetota bacterium]